MPEWDIYHNRKVTTPACHPYHPSVNIGFIVLGIQWRVGPGLGDLQMFNTEPISVLDLAYKLLVVVPVARFARFLAGREKA